MSDESPFSPPNPNGRPPEWDAERMAKIPEYKDVVVVRLREGMYISEIAETLDIASGTIRKWRNEDPVFEERCKESEEYYIDKHERELAFRSLHGMPEVVLHPITRQVVMDARHRDPDTGISTTPLIIMKKSSADNHFYLRHKRPEVFGEKKTVDSNVNLSMDAAAKEFDDKLEAMLKKHEK